MLHFSNWSLAGLVVFALLYFLVAIEEWSGIKKSKVALMGGSLIWLLLAAHVSLHESQFFSALHQHIKSSFEEFVELLLFLLVAITYVHALENRRVFTVLRQKILNLGLNFRQIFWITGGLTFFLSAILDNLTAALVMCAVALEIGQYNRSFIHLVCINIVVAANAGGVFSPFGDITTLMVWQKGNVNFFEFFKLFVPAVVNFMLPALCMHSALPRGKPTELKRPTKLAPGAKGVIFLFACTLLTAVLLQHGFGFSPTFGMMMGLGYLLLYTDYLSLKEQWYEALPDQDGVDEGGRPLNVFKEMQRINWDTFLFFYGIILGVSGLNTFGFLEAFSKVLYGYGDTVAHVLIGLMSALVDNIPVMYAVLNMKAATDLSLQQWLLVTLTTGVGGSLLAIGSAAGVALMGESKGHYTFTKHLKWAWAILLGYAGSVCTHLLLS